MTIYFVYQKGRHPEEHGIVGDFMYDLKNEQIFNASDLQSTRMAGWWKDASPFWSTAATHGKKIAFYNWHDCQLPGKPEIIIRISSNSWLTQFTQTLF